MLQPQDTAAVFVTVVIDAESFQSTSSITFPIDSKFSLSPTTLLSRSRSPQVGTYRRLVAVCIQQTDRRSVRPASSSNPPAQCMEQFWFMLLLMPHLFHLPTIYQLQQRAFFGGQLSWCHRVALPCVDLRPVIDFASLSPKPFSDHNFEPVSAVASNQCINLSMGTMQKSLSLVEIKTSIWDPAS